MPISLLSEGIVHEDGAGPIVDVSQVSMKVLLLTLGITRIIESEHLMVTVSGSEDGKKFHPEPLVSFPPKFYCGDYIASLDLKLYPEIRYLRVHWTVNRWGKRGSAPLFAFYVTAEERSVVTDSAVA